MACIMHALVLSAFPDPHISDCAKALEFSPSWQLQPFSSWRWFTLHMLSWGSWGDRAGGNIESRVGLCSQRQNMKNENRKEEHEAVDIEALTWSEDQPSCPGSELLLFGIFPRYIHLAFVA
ncbi:hypothetical protein VTJ04DRAFT_601 [Mycothermus thermophilus]|uniref:uncharacterized protein n=1 Tax=Humicola insolens TaxID=85995 RepID=UPI0037448127